MEEQLRVHIFVEGRVQGVFFRQNMKKKAKELQINGWVKNLADKRVEMLLEGKNSRIKDIMSWLKESPGFCRVDKIDIQKEEYKNEFSAFKIKK